MDRDYLKHRLKGNALALLAYGMMLAFVWPVAAAHAGENTSTLASEIRVLRNEVREVRGHEGDDAQYFFEAVTIVVGAATALAAIVAIVATVAGYRIVRTYIQSEFTTQAKAAYDEYGAPAVDKAIVKADELFSAKLAEVDAELARELEIFHKASRQ
jgi:hypothetical protein